jgi:small-conductance mechanosensitive channel
MRPDTASEWLIGGLGGFVSHLAALSPEDVAVNGALSALIVALAWAIRWGVHYAARTSARRLPAATLAEKVAVSRTVKTSWFVFHTLLTSAAVYLLLRVWGLDLAAWAASGSGAAVGREAWRLLVLGVLSAGAFELSGYAVGRLMNPLAIATHNPRRAAQLRTLAPLLRGIVQATVVVVAALTLLSEIGVKIAPLLAGAGVVGVAVGFGAQNLVKDFLTGLFLVIEDVVSVGDTVQISSFSGRVEAMTLRTIRLRDFDGTLHIFPYSEAQVIHNGTNLFAYAVIDVLVALDADVDKAIEVMRQTGEALAEHPDTAPKVLQPIEVLGVDSLGGAGVRLKGRIKTQPSARGEVARAYYHRLKQGFDQAGIPLSKPA